MRRNADGPTRYRLPISVLVYCFRQKVDDIEYLMLRRTAKYGGFWQGITGALENGETHQQGAARELWEETRYTPETIRSADYGYSFPMEDEWRWAYHPDVKEIHEQVFFAEIADGIDPVLSYEHDAFEWAPFDRALGLLKWPNNRIALEVCHQLLGGSHAESCSGQ